MLENRMVIGDYYAPDPIPDYHCPHCGRDWYETGINRYEDYDGYAVRGYPERGDRCTRCVWDERTILDAVDYLAEQGEAAHREVLQAIVEDIGAKAILRILRNDDADLVNETAECWAEEQDDYFDWVTKD